MTFVASPTRAALPNFSPIEERYGWSFLASAALHGALAVLLFVFPYLLPHTNLVPLGGPGGGTSGEIFTVGVADDLAGGTGMIKPALIPQPPALPEEKVAKDKPDSEAVFLPQTTEKKPPRKLQGKADQALPRRLPRSNCRT